MKTLLSLAMSGARYIKVCVNLLNVEDLSWKSVIKIESRIQATCSDENTCSSHI